MVLSSTLKGLEMKWGNYWFHPAPLFDLAMFRIIIVGYQLVWLVVMNYHGQLVIHTQMPDFIYQPLPVVRLLLLGSAYFPSTEVMLFVFWLTMIAGLCSLVGFHTRLSLGVFALGNLFIQGFVYSFGDYHHHEAVIMMALVVLALSPSGHALAIDDFVRRGRQSLKQPHVQVTNSLAETSDLAAWPLILIRWMLVLIYLSAFIFKIVRDQTFLHWLNGYTLQYYMLEDGLRWNVGLGVWLSGQHELSQLMSITAILFEGLFVLILFFPRLMWLFLPLGVVFHTSIYVIQRARFFSFIAAYSAFVPWTALLMYVARRMPKQQIEVFYDNLCPLCRRTIYTLSYFDWFGRLAYYDLNTDWQRLSQRRPGLGFEDALREMYVILPDGTVASGFFAFRSLWAALPACWPLALLTYLPFASTIGPKIYAFVAAHRTRRHCEDGVCSIQGRVPVAVSSPAGDQPRR